MVFMAMSKKRWLPHSLFQSDAKKRMPQIGFLRAFFHKWLFEAINFCPHADGGGAVLSRFLRNKKENPERTITSLRFDFMSLVKNSGFCNPIE